MNTPTQRESNYVNRFFGGPPLSVIFRLILLSILIGVILQVLGLDPWNIFDSLRRLVLHVWDMGFDALRWLWRYLLLGAVIVVPIWLIVRLMRVAQDREARERVAGLLGVGCTTRTLGRPRWRGDRPSRRPDKLVDARASLPAQCIRQL